MIEVTALRLGQPRRTWINPQHIESFFTDVDDYSQRIVTCIDTINDTRYSVLETPDEILKLLNPNKDSFK